MQKPWRPSPSICLKPINVRALSQQTRDALLAHSIEFVSLGFEHRGDFRLSIGDEEESVRFFQSVDGAILGRITNDPFHGAFELGSILADGTFVRSIPRAPFAPWSCCRFPVHVVFGGDGDVEELLVKHLKALAELEPGCGPTNYYEPHQLEDVVTYCHALLHETVYAQDAPDDPLTVSVLLSEAGAGGPLSIGPHAACVHD